MLLLLPVELLELILDHAIYEPPKISDRQLPASTISTTLISLVLTCRTIYRLLLPKLYPTLAVRTIPTPICIFNPSLVQYSTTLVVLPSNQRRRSSAQKRKAITALGTALERFNNIQTLILFTRSSSTLFKVANGYHLTSLTCEGRTLNYYVPNQWRLRSLSVQDCLPGPALTAVLSANSATLEYLALGQFGTKEHKPFPLMPKVRSLNLVGWDSEMIMRISAGIRFDHLNTLQLVDGEGHPSFNQNAYTPLKEAGGLAGLRKLSIQRDIYEACAILELTDGLEELHLVWSQGGQPHHRQQLARIIAAKCRGLKALSSTSPDVFTVQLLGMGLPFEAADLAMIATSCEGLEDVRIGVRHDHFHSTITALGLFTNLRHLHIDLWAFGCGPYQLSPLDRMRQDGNISREHRQAAVEWALETVKEGLQTVDGISVTSHIMNHEVSREWIKPGAPVRDVCTGELRRRLKFPILGRGVWNDAFKPVGFGTTTWWSGVML